MKNGNKIIKYTILYINIFLIIITFNILMINTTFTKMQATIEEQVVFNKSIEIKYDNLKLQYQQCYMKLSALELDLIKTNADGTEETYNEPESNGEVHNHINYIKKDLPIGIGGGFKTYMDYRAITDKKSKQWELQQSATTDEQGFRRYDGLYMIALGTYYSPKVGMKFNIELSSGNVIECITGDIKDNRHTDSTNRYIEKNGNIVEFIVDTKKINPDSKKRGDMSYSGMDGDVVSIIIVDNKN